MYDPVGPSVKMPTTKQLLLGRVFWYDCQRLMRCCRFHIATLAFLLSVFTVLVSACFDPTRSESLNCSADGLCPDGLSCLANNLCGQPIDRDAAVPAPLQLAALTIEGLPLQPAFQPLEQFYSADSSVIAQSVVITAQAASDTAILQVNGESVASGVPSSPLPLQLGQNSIVLTLTSGTQSASYEIIVNRGSKPATQTLYGKASNAERKDRFANSLSISGDTLVVGAPLENSGASGINGDQSDDSAGNSGAVYVFRRKNSQWLQEAYIKSSNPESGDLFGEHVAIAGNTLVVSAKFEDSSATGVDGDQSSNDAPDSGAVYVFSRTGTTWSQEAYLKAANTDARDEFGTSVAIENDIIVVGAMYEDSEGTNMFDNSANSSGAVYIFERDTLQWRQSAYLKSSNIDPFDSFGEQVAISGTTIVVGARFESSDATTINGDQNNASDNSGAAYVFVRNANTWEQQAYLKASDSEIYANFGSAVDIDGDTIAVGAPKHDHLILLNTGSAYIFQRNGSQWSQQAKLLASTPDEQDRFGDRVSLRGDRLLVAALNESSDAVGVDGTELNNSKTNSGAVYLFVHSPDSLWTKAAYLKASNTDLEDAFGSSMTLSSSMVILGTPMEDSTAIGLNGDQANNAAPEVGAFYVFE